MSMFKDVQDQIMSHFSEWIKVEDDKNIFTIEDFTYTFGVVGKHCWKCVTVNQCWFKNEESKKPKKIKYSDDMLENTKLYMGIYHPNCHCIENPFKNPLESDIKFVIPEGKVSWMIKDKGHLMNEMGYAISDYNEVIEILLKLIAIEYTKGNYIVREHDEKGFRISFVLNDFPGKNEDEGKFYKLKTPF